MTRQDLSRTTALCPPRTTPTRTRAKKDSEKKLPGPKTGCGGGGGTGQKKRYSVRRSTTHDDADYMFQQGAPRPQGSVFTTDVLGARTSLADDDDDDDERLAFPHLRPGGVVRPLHSKREKDIDANRGASSSGIAKELSSGVAGASSPRATIEAPESSSEVAGAPSPAAAGASSTWG